MEFNDSFSVLYYTIAIATTIIAIIIVIAIVSIVIV